MSRVRTIVVRLRGACAGAGAVLAAVACLVAGPARACDTADAQVAEATPPATPRAPRAPRAPESPTIFQLATPTAAKAPAPPDPPDAGFEQPSPALLVPRGWFGFGFQCGECSAKSNPADSAAVWRFGSWPTVYSVDLGGPAARAGFRRGDIITHLDGISILSPEGGRRFGAIRPGQVVRWAVLREGMPRYVVARAEERPERRERVALTDLRRELSRLNEMSDLDQLRRELATLNRRLERARTENAQAAQAYQDAQRAQADVMRERMTLAPARRLRYAGVIGGTSVEVRGPGSIIVSQSDLKDELVINTGEAVVVIRVPDGLQKRTADKPK